MITETAGWRGGKKTRHGVHLDVEPETVTIVTSDGIERFLGCRGKRLREYLRQLRAEGRLISEPGRLTQRVRMEAPGTRYGVRHVRCYVIRGRKQSIPTAKQARLRRLAESRSS